MNIFSLAAARLRRPALPDSTPRARLAVLPLEDRLAPADFRDVGGLRFFSENDSFAATGGTTSTIKSDVQVGLTPAAGQAFTALAGFALPDGVTIDANPAAPSVTINSTLAARGLTFTGDNLTFAFDTPSSRFSVSGKASFAFQDLDDGASVGVDFTARDGASPGLVLQGDGNGSLSLQTFDVALSGGFSVDKVSFAVNDLRMGLDTTGAGTTFTMTGGAKVTYEGAKNPSTGRTNAVDMSVTFGGGQTPGLTITNGRLDQLNVQVDGGFKVAGLEVSAKQLTFAYDRAADSYGLSGSVAVSTAQPASGRRVLDNFGVTLGDGENPGILIQSGVLERLDFSLNGTVNLSSLAVTPEDLRVRYTRATSVLQFTGAIGVSLAAKFNARASLPNGGITVNTETGAVQVNGVRLDITDTKLGSVTIRNAFVEYTDDGNGSFNLLGGATVDLPAGLTVSGSFDIVSGRLRRIQLSLQKDPGFQIPNTPVFVNFVSGTLDNLDDPNNLIVTGTVGFTAGPSYNLGGKQVALLTATVSLTLDVGNADLIFRGDMKLFGVFTLGQGSLTFDFVPSDPRQFTVSAHAEGVFFSGFVKASLDFNINNTGNFQVTATAKLVIPTFTIPKFVITPAFDTGIPNIFSGGTIVVPEVAVPETPLGGQELASAQVTFDFVANNPRASSISGSFSVLGGFVDADFRVTFDGTLTVNAKVDFKLDEVSIPEFTVNLGELFSDAPPPPPPPPPPLPPPALPPKPAGYFPAINITNVTITDDRRVTVDLSTTTLNPRRTDFAVTIATDQRGPIFQSVGNIPAAGGTSFSTVVFDSFFPLSSAGETLTVSASIADSTFDTPVGSGTPIVGVPIPPGKPAAPVGYAPTLTITSVDRQPATAYRPFEQLVIRFRATTLNPQATEIQFFGLADGLDELVADVRFDRDTLDGEGAVVAPLTLFSFLPPGTPIELQGAIFDDGFLSTVSADAVPVVVGPNGTAPPPKPTAPAGYAPGVTITGVERDAPGSNDLRVNFTATTLNPGNTSFQFSAGADAASAVPLAVGQSATGTAPDGTVFGFVVLTNAVGLLPGDRPVSFFAQATDATFEGAFGFSAPFGPIAGLGGQLSLTAPAAVEAPGTVPVGFTGPARVAVTDPTNGAVRVTVTATSGALTLAAAVTPAAVTVTGAGTAAVTLQGPVADVNAALAGLTYLRPSGAIEDTLTVVAGRTSITGGSGLARVISVPARPLRLTLPAAGPAVTQAAAPVLLFPGATVETESAAPLVLARVAVVAPPAGTGFEPGADALSVVLPAGSPLRGLFNPFSGELTISGQGTAADYQAALAGVQFASTGTPTGRVLRVTVADAAGRVESATMPVTIADAGAQSAVPPTDPRPFVTTTPGGPTYTGTAVAVDPGLTIDFLGATLASARAFFSWTFDPTADVLGFTPVGGITATFNAAAGVLSLTGAGTVAEYQEALRGVTFRSLRANPAGYARQVTFTVTDGVNDSLRRIARRQIQVSVPAVPVVVAADTAPLPVPFGGAAVPLLPDLTLTNPDAALPAQPLALGQAEAGTVLARATVAIGNYVPNEDVLTFAPAAGITGQFDIPSGQLFLTGTGTLAEYQQVIRSVQYRNANTSPSTADRPVTLTLDDGSAGGNPATVVRVVRPQSDGSRTTRSGTVAPLVLGPSDPGGSLGLGDLAFTLRPGETTLVLTVTAAPQATLGTVRLADGTTAKAGQAVTLDQLRGATFVASATPRSGTVPFTFTAAGLNPITGAADPNPVVTTVPIQTTNVTPDAAPDAVLTQAGKAVEIGVLANDTDGNQDPLTVAAFTQPRFGVVTGGKGLSLVYTPNPGATGTDSFTYTLSDGNGGESIGTVTVRVNAPPAATADAFTVPKNSAGLSLGVLANDTLAPDNGVPGERLTLTALTAGDKGGRLAIGADAATVKYTPAAGFQGVETFAYTVSDGAGGTATATVTVTVAAENNPPVAFADTFTTAAGTSATLNVLANDSVSPDTGETLSVVAVTPGNRGGTVAVAANGTRVTYQPAAGFAGTETFTYTASDGNGGTATATVTMLVRAGATSPPPVSPPARTGSAPLPPSALLVGGPDGRAVPFTASGGRYQPGDPVAFPGLAGPVRTATADLDGDGTADLIGATGPGVPAQVVVLSGTDRRLLASFRPYGDGYTGGLSVAATGPTAKGFAFLAVSPDGNGLGPLVRVFRGDALADATTGPAVLAEFLGLASLSGEADTSFKGGGRVGVGDVTGDGVPDLVVGAGDTGGPRVTVWDGGGFAGANGGRPTSTPVGNLFVFESTLRNGVFVAGGDVTGDGRADLVFGGGPGGGPRVRVVDGNRLLGLAPSELELVDLDSPTNLANGLVVNNFFTGDPESRGGVRVTVRDVDGDAAADLVTGSGDGQASAVRVYLGSALAAVRGQDGREPASSQDPLDPFGATLAAGVFVG